MNFFGILKSGKSTSLANSKGSILSIISDMLYMLSGISLNNSNISSLDLYQYS